MKVGKLRIGAMSFSLYGAQSSASDTENMQKMLIKLSCGKKEGNVAGRRKGKELELKHDHPGL